MKFFRWNLRSEYRKEYLNVMKKIDIYMALLSKYNILEKVYKYRVLSRENFAKIENDIRTQLVKLKIPFDNNVKQNINLIVEKYLEKYIEYFSTKLNTNVLDNFAIQYQRGLDSRITISQKTLQERVKQGIKCPFFSVDIEEYKRFIKLTYKLHLELKNTINCFLKISEDTKVDIRDLLDIAEEGVRNNEKRK
jgi:hypothetical protein